MDEARAAFQHDFQTREAFLLWQIGWYCTHDQTRFDVTFYDREPLLAVTFDHQWAKQFRLLILDRKLSNLPKLLKAIKFSDGSPAHINDVWTFNYMPDDLDMANVDLSAGNDVIGEGGETTRQIIRETYHCATRAEEDWFLARWIAS